MGKVVKAIHDIGTAVWWGGTLMGTLAMNPAVEVLDDPEERGKMVDEGWARFQPYAAAGLLATIGTHICMRRHPPHRPSAAYRSATALKDLCLVTAVVSSVASLALGEYSTHYDADGYTPLDEGQDDSGSFGACGNGISLASWAQLISGLGLFVTGAICSAEREKPIGRFFSRH